MATPKAEVDLDHEQVRELLASQHPDLAGLPITPLDAGWDNQMWRLGPEWVVRLPRRALAAQLIVNEQRWLPEVARGLEIAIPVPARIGKPEFGYPWHWSIVPWFDGETADRLPLAQEEAPRLAQVLRALHQPAPRAAPVNLVRGCPLADRCIAFEERLHRVQTQTPCYGPELATAWQRGLQAPVAKRRCWLHGDLHARNVLVRNGALQAIIDWGDITAGDAATDLASVWMLLSSHQARQTALASYEADAALRARSMAWAILFGVILLDTGLVDHPAHERMGRVTLARVTADLRETSGRS